MEDTQLYCQHCGAITTENTENCFVCSTPLMHGVDGIDTTFLLNKRYRILTPIGTGGFGTVYKVEDTLNENTILAIKQINLRGLSAQEIIEATETFHREVSLLAPLDHPGLPHIYEHFTDPHHWYVVMDFIEGETLETYLDTKLSQLARAGMPPLSLDEVLVIGIQLCIALEYLHTQRPPIVFRDLKPANIMRTAQGNLFLIDFGIARHFKPGKVRDTIPLGSPGYAAPEQYGRAQTTPRSDIYSLGALLHQLLSGMDPSESPFQFAPLRSYGETGLAELDVLIQQMVQMEADGRPASIIEVKEQLERFQLKQHRLRFQLSDTPIPQGVVPPWQQQSSRQAASPYYMQQQVAGLPRNATRRTFTRSIIGVAALLAGGGVVGYANSYQQALARKTSRMSSSLVSSIRVPPQSQATPAVVWPPEAAVWAPNSRHVALISQDGTVKIKDAYSKGGSQTYPHKGTALAWSPDSTRIISNVTDTALQIWNAQSGTPLTPVWFGPYPPEIPSSAQKIEVVAWSPDGKLIAIGGSPSLCVVDALTGSIVFTTATSQRSPTVALALSWSPDSTRLAFSQSLIKDVSSSVSIWDRRSEVVAFPYQSASLLRVETLSWSPDGTTLAFNDWDLDPAGRGEILHIWNMAYKYFPPLSEPFHISNLAWSTDSKRLAIGGGTGATVWDVVNAVVIPFHEIPYYIAAAPISETQTLAVAWANNNKSVLLADNNGQLHVWQAI